MRPDKSSRKKDKTPKGKLVWERGYLGHTLWLGKDCIGRISLERGSCGVLYRCRAGSLEEQTDNLKRAKKWVAAHAVFSQAQQRLF